MPACACLSVYAFLSRVCLLSVFCVSVSVCLYMFVSLCDYLCQSVYVGIYVSVFSLHVRVVAVVVFSFIRVILCLSVSICVCLSISVYVCPRAPLPLSPCALVGFVSSLVALVHCALVPSRFVP